MTTTIALMVWLWVLVVASARAEPPEPVTQIGRDPFQVLPSNGDEGGGPLQHLALAQLRLAAVLSGEMSRALLQDDAGNGYIVAVGAFVGTHGGIVTSIAPGRLLIEEPGGNRGDSRQTVLELFSPAIAEARSGARR